MNGSLARCAKILALHTQSGRCAIMIEPGLLNALGSIVRAHAVQANKVLLVVDDAVIETHGVVAKQSLEAAGLHVTVATVHAAEANKTLATVERLYRAMLAAAFERMSVVVALGGGLVCDVAGFAAATFHRGVPIVMAPTTLLAMVDAAIGGKNGVNLGLEHWAMGTCEHAHVHGSRSSAQRPFLKNMIGTIWQPCAIVVDPAALATLPMRHLRCGLAESIKVAMLRDESMIEVIRNAPDAAARQDWNALTELIARSVAIKASIVQADEHEDAPGGRVLLNLGHTFAHAFETLPDLTLMHGEAVAIGLCAAATCARLTGRIESTKEQRWREVIAGAGLPTQLPSAAPVATLLAMMQRDKKVLNGKVRLVLPLASAGAELVDDVPERVVVTALQDIGAVA